MLQAVDTKLEAALALIVPAWLDYASANDPAGLGNAPGAVARSKAEVTRGAPRARPVSPPPTTAAPSLRREAGATQRCVAQARGRRCPFCMLVHLTGPGLTAFL